MNTASYRIASADFARFLSFMDLSFSSLSIRLLFADKGLRVDDKNEMGVVVSMRGL